MSGCKKGFAFLAAGLALSLAVSKAETYHRVALSGLDFQKDQPGLPEALREGDWFSSVNTELIALRFPGEAYLADRVDLPNRPNVPRQQVVVAGDYQIAFLLAGNTKVSGEVDLPLKQDDGRTTTTRSFAFSVDPITLKTCTKEEFEAVRTAHYNRLLRNNRIPGGAWFRHRIGQSKPGERNRANLRQDELLRTFDLFTGSRAISENLALDRELILGAVKNGKRYKIDEIKGVTVKAIDWTGRLPAEEITIDSLSLALPHDQHAAFFPSLDSLFDLADRLETQGAPVLQSFSLRSPYRSLATRYRTQLGLDLPDVAAKLLPIKSVAITGGDPFFPTGTDVAVLLETEKPEVLYQRLLKGIKLKAAQRGATSIAWSGAQAEHQGFQTADRSFSSHLMRKGNLVVITNSTAQLDRLLAVGDTVPALGASDEFQFFRHRYPTGAENAFLFLSDATLRRWTGPTVRIGASRRTRALAALSQLNAQLLDGQKPHEEFEGLLGKVTQDGNSVRSARHGTVRFLSPVSELEIQTVSETEKRAYERWRIGYESGWAQVFDPIALQIKLTKETVDLDLTVLPLTTGTDYDDILNLAGSAKLTTMARTTPDNSLLHLAMAIDRKSELFKEFDQELPGLIPGLKINPLAWVGESVSLTLEDDFFWKALRRVGTRSNSEMLFHIPVVARIESNSRLKLAAFLVGLKGAVNQSSPGLLTWNVRTHGESSYVVVSGDEDEFGEGAIYYAALKMALLVSLDEEVLKRAIDRELAGPSEKEAVPSAGAGQLLVEAKPSFLLGIRPIFGEADIEGQRQSESWRALPILNEWRRLFPDRDPIAVHEETLGFTLHCPGGKGFRWDAKAHSMESVAYGRPSAPRTDADPLPLLGKYSTLRAGLEFSEGGLRARLHAGPTKEPKIAAKPIGRLLATAAEITNQKVGSVMSYKGQGPEGEESMTVTVKSVQEKVGAIIIVEESINEVAGERYTGTTRTRLHKGLARIESRGVSPSPSYDAKPGPRAPEKKDRQPEPDKQGLLKSSTVYDPPAMELPAELHEGMVLTYPASGITEGDDLGTEKILAENRVTIVGLEDVKVPAGTFKDCIRIETRTQGLYGDYYTVENEVSWWAMEIGVVKYERSPGNHTTTMELIKISRK